MQGTTPVKRFLLVKDAVDRTAADRADMDDLQNQIGTLLGSLERVEIAPHGRSAAYATMPARNQREYDQLKALLNERIHGWHVLDERSYDLPRTF